MAHAEYSISVSHNHLMTGFIFLITLIGLQEQQCRFKGGGVP